MIEVKKGKNSKKYVYFAYNKPIGTITHSPQKKELDIKEKIKKTHLLKYIAHDIFPIGRLDKNSGGLIILTNDGRITDQLLNPRYSHKNIK